MDYSPLGSSVHGISQVGILGWVAISFSRGSSWPRDWAPVSYIAGRFLTTEASGKTIHVCLCVYWFFVCLFCFCFWYCMSSLYVLDISPLSEIWFSNISSQPIVFMFFLLIVCFAKFFKFDTIPPVYCFCILFPVLLVSYVKKLLIRLTSRKFFPAFF